MVEDTVVKEDAQAAVAPRPALDPQLLPGSIEAILLTLDKPVTARRLAEALGLSPVEEPTDEDRPARGAKTKAKAAADGVRAVEEAVAALNSVYEQSGRSFRIESVAGGLRVMTLPVFAPAVAAFHRARASGRLSRAAVETLAIIAYKQPLTRAQLEAIRGVSCGEVLRSLLERRLVEIKGRAEELGRPLLYGTGKPFLDAFGLGSLRDLPTSSELKVAS
jgi:segregation and condensation protein B